MLNVITVNPIAVSSGLVASVAIACPTAKLGKAEINLLAKLESFGVKIRASEDEIRSNPFTGVSRTLSPVAAALMDFITVSYRAYSATYRFNYRGHAFPVSVWDRTRYLFLKLWPKEYYDLID